MTQNVEATGYPSFRGKLNPVYVSEERVVVDGNCVTSQGPGTAIEFALKLVELLFEPQKAKEFGNAMVVSTT